MAKNLPFVARLFKGWTMRAWYLKDEDADDSDSDDNTGNDDEDLTNVTIDGVTYTFASTYDTEAETVAVAALEEAVASEDEETVDEFEAVVGEDDVLTEYLGCYEVTAETGVLTLASPVEVTDPEVYTAIVLHYNTETETWEQVDDVQIIDGYVYAVFTSLSPVAVYTVKKKYVATVTLGEDVTSYEDLAEAVAYAEANLASAPVVTLTWNKSVTEPITLYSTSDGTVTFELDGYTIYGSVEGGYVVNVAGDACTKPVVVQNGAIVADDTTLGTINIADVYATIDHVDCTATCVGGSNVVVDSVKITMLDSDITSENGNAVEIKATNTAALTATFTRCNISTTNTDENQYPALYIPNHNDNAYTLGMNNSVITGDVYGLYNDSVAGKCYYHGDSSCLTAPTAIYVSANHTGANAFYTGSTDTAYVNGAIVCDSDAEGVIGLKLCQTTVAIEDAWISSGYCVYANDDETYTYKTDIDQVAECTNASGTVTYKNSLSSSALSAAGSGGTVKMLKDCTTTGIGSISTDGVTIDLNGHTVTFTTSGIYSTSKDYTLTIKNGNLVSTSTTAGGSVIKFTRGNIIVEDVNISADADDFNGIVVGNTSADYAPTCTVSGNSVISADTGILVMNKTGNTNQPTLTVEDGVTINSTAYAVTGNGSYDGTIITINGGTFNGDAAAIYHPQAGTLTINGGTFNGGETGIQMCDGDLYFNDGTVSVTGTDDMANKTGDGNIPDAAAISVVNRSGYSTTYPTVTLVGGTFKSANGEAVKAYAWSSNAESEWDATGYIKISGGSYSNVIDKYLEDGYTCATEAVDGLYTVSASGE